MGSRTLPHYCEHGVPVDGGDFVDSVECKDCELTRYRNGYKAMSDTDDLVYIKELESQLAESRERVAELEHYNLGLATESHCLQEQVRVLWEALDAIAESDPDESPGMLRDIANEALAATAPEAGEESK